ncbi:MAG: acyl-ACP--UDP-N-acetylglucosamine O-acyltransferase [bacterium]|jgi:UDP-N-acetylglucosamine acyltransferase
MNSPPERKQAPYSLVHPTAIIDPEAEVHRDVEIGPYVVIGPRVTISKGVTLGPHVVVGKDTTVGEDCNISTGAVIGGDPQDLKYEGENSHLYIGSATTIREYATLNRGTAASGETRVGSGCLIMAYAHVAHDCILGDNVVISNAVNMGGHVDIKDGAIIGGLTAIHQFVKIGRHSFCGGASRVTQDIPPFVRVAGNPVKLYGLNTVGLARRKIPDSVVGSLRKAYQDLFQSDMNLGQALDKIELGGLTSEVEELVEFIRSSKRGVVT